MDFIAKISFLFRRAFSIMRTMTTERTTVSCSFKFTQQVENYRSQSIVWTVWKNQKSFSGAAVQLSGEEHALSC